MLSTEGGNGTQDRRSGIAVLCRQTGFIRDVERTDRNNVRRCDTNPCWEVAVSSGGREHGRTQAASVSSKQWVATEAGYLLFHHPSRTAARMIWKDGKSAPDDNAVLSDGLQSLLNEQ